MGWLTKDWKLKVQVPPPGRLPGTLDAETDPTVAPLLETTNLTVPLGLTRPLYVAPGLWFAQAGSPPKTQPAAPTRTAATHKRDRI